MAILLNFALFVESFSKFIDRRSSTTLIICVKRSTHPHSESTSSLVNESQNPLYQIFFRIAKQGKTGQWEPYLFRAFRRAQEICWEGFSEKIWKAPDFFLTSLRRNFLERGWSTKKIGFPLPSFALFLWYSTKKLPEGSLMFNNLVVQFSSKVVLFKL